MMEELLKRGIDIADLIEGLIRDGIGYAPQMVANVSKVQIHINTIWAIVGCVVSSIFFLILIFCALVGVLEDEGGLLIFLFAIILIGIVIAVISFNGRYAWTHAPTYKFIQLLISTLK